MRWINIFAEHYEKFGAGFGVATGITSFAFQYFDKIEPATKLTISAGAYIVCCGAAYAWAQYDGGHFLRKRVSCDEIEELFLVTEPEENLAYIANKFVRR